MLRDMDQNDTVEIDSEGGGYGNDDFLYELKQEKTRAEKGREVHKNRKKKKQTKYEELDADDAELFEIVDCGHGDEFMAVLPWKGSIKEPTTHPEPSKEKPEQVYKIDFAFGVTTDETRKCVFFNS